MKHKMPRTCFVGCSMGYFFPVLPLERLHNQDATRNNGQTIPMGIAHPPSPSLHLASLMLV
ncbi:hypothetical protein B0O80DRAFT_465549 [Mortierella sp. GBAus27b]|nr:hypothetical protein B0O80DRAFT_465549 [Mortierella sp. GBAus27b]